MGEGKPRPIPTNADRRREGDAIRRQLNAASAMLAALEAVEELFPKAPPPAIAKKATENFRRFQHVRAAIAAAKAAGIKAGA